MTEQATEDRAARMRQLLVEGAEKTDWGFGYDECFEMAYLLAWATLERKEELLEEAVEGLEKWHSKTGNFHTIEGLKHFAKNALELVRAKRLVEITPSQQHVLDKLAPFCNGWPIEGISVAASLPLSQLLPILDQLYERGLITRNRKLSHTHWQVAGRS